MRRWIPIAAGLLLAALLVWGAASAEAIPRSKRQKQPPPVTYPRVEWRQSQYEDGAVQAQWQVLVKSPEDLPLRHGTFRRYHPNGRQSLLAYYQLDQPAGIWSWLDDRGNLLRQVRQRADFDDEIVGDQVRSPVSTFRNPAGRVTAEGLLKGDSPHGHWRFFHASGAPQAEGNFLTGVADGTWNYYYTNGQIERQMSFALGVPHGPYRSAYDNAQEEELGQFNQGVREGPWRTYYRNGQLREEGAYQDDRRQGEWRVWEEDGTLSNRIVYHTGRIVSELPLPPEPPRREPVIPNAEERSTRPPAMFDSAGQPIVTPDEDALPPKPPEKRKLRRDRPPPLTQWEHARVPTPKAE